MGDMDFKVTGTKDGITATQLDIKVDGLEQMDDLLTEIPVSAYTMEQIMNKKPKRIRHGKYLLFFILSLSSTFCLFGGFFFLFILFYQLFHFVYQFFASYILRDCLLYTSRIVLPFL